VGRFFTLSALDNTEFTDARCIFYLSSSYKLNTFFLLIDYSSYGNGINRILFEVLCGNLPGILIY